MEGFVPTTIRTFIFWFIVACTGGVFYLMYYWFKKQAIRIIYKSCPLDEAHYVLVTGWDNHFEFAMVQPLSRLPITSEKERVFNLNGTLPFFQFSRFEFQAISVVFVLELRT